MRYGHITKYKEIQDKGHKILETKSVAIVGLGNLGSTIATMLLQKGIGLRLIDKGRVDIIDLSSQALYLEEDHSKFKAKQAKKYLETLNPKVKIRTFHEELTKNNTYLIDADVVIDVSGNLNTTKLIVDETKKKKTPLIFAAVSGSKGLLIATDKGFAIEKIKKTLDGMKPIEEAGLINPSVHMASAIIVAKTLKFLLKKNVAKEIVEFDVWEEKMKRTKI